jgi:hypothetical protein
MDRAAGAADQLPEDPLGQVAAGGAVAGRLGGDRGEPLVVAGLLKSIDGLVTGVVLGEDLREEEAQGDPGRIDPLAPPMAYGAASRRDDGAREQCKEGEALPPGELIAGGDELVGRGRCGRLNHGDLLGVATGGHVHTASLPAQEVALHEEVASLNHRRQKGLRYPRAIPL